MIALVRYAVLTAWAVMISTCTIPAMAFVVRALVSADYSTAAMGVIALSYVAAAAWVTQSARAVWGGPPITDLSLASAIWRVRRDLDAHGWSRVGAMLVLGSLIGPATHEAHGLWAYGGYVVVAAAVAVLPWAAPRVLRKYPPTARRLGWVAGVGS